MLVKHIIVLLLIEVKYIMVEVNHITAVCQAHHDREAKSRVQQYNSMWEVMYVKNVKPKINHDVGQPQHGRVTYYSSTYRTAVGHSHVAEVVYHSMPAAP